MMDELTTTFRRFVTRDEERSAAAMLGPTHPLTRALALRRTLRLQALSTFLPLVLATAGLLRHVERAAVVLAVSAAVALALAGGILLIEQTVRERARDLVATGIDHPLLPAVVIARRRLGFRSTRERLACSLERYLRDSERWYDILPRSRPLANGVRHLRSAACEVGEVARLVRSDSPRVEGVALLDGFLTDSQTSPLFAEDPDHLKRELRYIARVLEDASDQVERRLAA